MTCRIDRRGFLKTTGAVGAGLAVSRLPRLLLAAEAVKCSTPNAEKLGWLLSVQMYTFRRFSFYEALDMTAKLGIRCVEACYYLRLDKDRSDVKVNELLSPKDRKDLWFVGSGSHLCILQFGSVMVRGHIFAFYNSRSKMLTAKM